ncbi:MAG: ribonuclease J [Desulfomonilaceae bacterium]|nr:ribonuclease J [Desulfomonilaceae bacterium]
MTDGNYTNTKVLPLGGLGEIGLNTMVVSAGKDAFIIDSGLMFPDDSMPGVDIVIPDMDAILRQDWKIHGYVLTHGHEDHIGALPYALKKAPAPVFATRLTMGLVENKLDEFGLLGTTERNIISADVPITLGPFGIDFFAVCHSVADGVGLIIQTPAGIIVHSGDFKLDPTPIDGRLCDIEKLAFYSGKNVLALFSDSTNVENKGTTLSESMIRPAFESIFREAEHRILIATFSSNIHRIQQVLDIASEFDKKVVLVGRSMIENTRIASERGYLRVPPRLLVDIKDMESVPDERTVVLSTGSQGEPMSALSLMAYDRHKYLRVKPGDVVVFSSRFIPGNEKAINQIINEFSRRGAQVMYEKISNVHVSGHASEDELRYLIRLVNPRYFVPIHGEYRHLLRHAGLAVEEGIPRERVLIAEDGDLIEFGPDEARITDRLEAGRVFVHGKGVGDIGHDVLRERRVLSEVGVVVVVLAVESQSGKLVSGPVLHSSGVTFGDVEPELMESVRAGLMERVEQLSPKNLQEWEESKEEIRLAVRRQINRILGRKPVVLTVILNV